MYDYGIAAQVLHIIIGGTYITAELPGCFPGQHTAQLQIADPYRAVFPVRCFGIAWRCRITAVIIVILLLLWVLGRRLSIIFVLTRIFTVLCLIRFFRLLGVPRFLWQRILCGGIFPVLAIAAFVIFLRLWQNHRPLLDI